VLPELDGRLDGFAMRVPTINVSVVDLTFTPSRATTAEEVNAAVQAAAEGPLEGVLGYTEEPLVSIDFNHNPASSVLDAGLTKVSGDGKLVKVCSWYDTTRVRKARRWRLRSSAWRISISAGAGC
jgi:glyceraldehyde 3-phosphate dehydrogenase